MDATHEYALKAAKAVAGRLRFGEFYDASPRIESQWAGLIAPHIDEAVNDAVNDLKVVRDRLQDKFVRLSELVKSLQVHIPWGVSVSKPLVNIHAEITAILDGK